MFLFAVLGLGFLIFIHELGHYLAAKAFGVKVNAFFIGFGPKIIKWTRGETEYGVSAIPLGGYVRLAGMEGEPEMDPDEERRGFPAQTLWKKVLIIVAGVLMNVIITVPFFAVTFLEGVPEPTTTIAQVVPKSGAAQAGMKDGDRIVEIEGREIKRWEQIRNIIQKHDGKKVDVVVERDGEKRKLEPEIRKVQGVEGQPSQKGIGIVTKAKLKRYGFFQSILLGAQSAYQLTIALVAALWMLISGQIPANMLVKGSAGPVGIGVLLTDAAQRGVSPFFFLLGAISINLAVINILPLPPLDGGRALLLFIEKAIGRPIGKERLMQIQTIGMVFLLTLIALVIFSDFYRIFTGGFRNILSR